MIRKSVIRKSVIAMAVLALAVVSVSSVEAGGGGRSGKGRPATPPAPAATTRTIVNQTARSWFTYVYSGTGTLALTVGAATQQGAKVIAPGQRAVFNVKPINGGASPSGDEIVINATPPLVVSDPNASIDDFSGGDGQSITYPALSAGQNLTITITQSGTGVPPDFTPFPR